MAFACAGLQGTPLVEWDLGAAAPGARRSPLRQAGVRLAALGRLLKVALSGPADRGLEPEPHGR
jgi:hypothetical protein